MKKRELKIRNLKIIKLPISQIHESECNIHLHSQFQFSALDSAVNEIGWYGYPDVYIDGDGKYRLCDGHLRKSLIEKKYGKDSTVEVNLTDFDDEEARKAMLTKDRLSSMAEYDGNAVRDVAAAVQLESSELNQIVSDILEQIGPIEPEPKSASVASGPEKRPERRYPLALVLKPADWKEWITFKRSVGIQSDSDAFKIAFDAVLGEQQ